MARSLVHSKSCCSAFAFRACALESHPGRVHLPGKARNARVLVLGGTGRVGGSTALALSNLSPDLQIVVGGRNREKGDSMVATLGKNSAFAQVDIDDMVSLERAMDDVDLVVHAAGPFQQAQNCNVLEAAIATKTAYADVCDDTRYALHARSFNDKAAAANIPAITTGGIYPGVSNVMAAELVRAAKDESKGEPEKLRFYYYTAGTGGAGPTILATSFLLLGEEVVAYSKGEEIKLKPYSGGVNIDFGKGIGKRDVFLLNLPEVRSAHEILGVPTVSARFGTAPFFWNWGMSAMTNLLPPVTGMGQEMRVIDPFSSSFIGLEAESCTDTYTIQEYLRDRSKVQELVQLFDPVVRAIDGIAGERVSMRVDLECSDGRHAVSIFTHRRLSVSVGYSTAAFVLAILEGSSQPGVWFPEEPEGIAVEAREILLKRASQGTTNFVMNKPPWMVETAPKEVGLGIYV